MAAIGGTAPARRAGDRGTDRHDHPRPASDRVRLEHDARRRAARSRACEQRLEPDGDADAADDADHRGDEADDDRLEQDRASTWRRLAPMRAQQRHLRVRWATMIENVL